MTFIDLSVELKHHMVRFPSPYLPEVTLVPAATHAKEKRSAHILTCGTHVSTHVDAPFHSISDGKTIDQIPLSQLVGPARVIRFLGRKKDQPLDAADFAATPGLESVEKLVIDTGWGDAMWGTQDYFTEGPHMTREACRFLAALPKLHLLAMDFPNVDCLHETVMGVVAPNHQIILGREMVMVENLMNMTSLADWIWFSAVPPKLVGGDGCPARAYAVSPLSALTQMGGL